MPSFKSRIFKQSVLELQRHKTLYTVLAGVIGGSYAFHMQNIFNEERMEDNVAEYINLSKNKDTLVDDSRSHFVSITNENHKRPSYATLLELAKSSSSKVRYNAVTALSKMTHLDKSEYCMIAQACDLKTAIAFARIPYSVSEFFLPPPSKLYTKSEETIEAQFLHVFQSLPVGNSNKCADYLTQYAHQHLHLYPYANDYLVADFAREFDDYPYWLHQRKDIFITYMIHYLEALLAHSRILHHRPLIVQSGALNLLQQVEKSYPQNRAVKNLIAQIIGNIAMNKNLHKAIFSSGWVGILSSWIKMPEIEISLPAARALANMDIDENDQVLYDDGLYVLYPQFYQESPAIEADVVFIHGLMGGAFRTWRQHDSMNKDTSSVVSKGNYDNSQMPDAGYTFCWPRDWLAKKFPFLRLVAIDFYSHASEWKSKCPVDKDKRDIKSRSKDTLKKLVDAGIGKRPVIWVSHSMGGLLVKQMLLDAAESVDFASKSVVENTVGIVFYSVPHKGVDANIGYSAMLFLQPSVEAQQLTKSCPKLLQMHENFVQLASNRRIPILSFGETFETHLGLHWKSVLVSSDSADPGIGEFIELSVSHLNSCKPTTKDAVGYFLLVKFLSSILQKHPVWQELFQKFTKQPKANSGG